MDTYEIAAKHYGITIKQAMKQAQHWASLYDDLHQAIKEHDPEWLEAYLDGKHENHVTFECASTEPVPEPMKVWQLPAGCKFKLKEWPTRGTHTVLRSSPLNSRGNVVLTVMAEVEFFIRPTSPYYDAEVILITGE